MSAVLDSLREQRANELAAMDNVLSKVEGRDLVDAEKSLLEAARERVAAIDAQIAPLAEWETLREVHTERVAELPRPSGDTVPAQPRRMSEAPRDFPYRTPGEFLVDYIRAQGYMDRGAGRDEQASARVAAAYSARADQTTADTPGLLPTPIVGAVVSLVDAVRPLISSLGGSKSLGNIPGTTFQRPKVTTHTTVGKQTAEKTALPSQKMVIGQVTFTKETWGGFVDISRQDIDWTSPSAWDILVKDLAEQYALQTEGAVSAAFRTAATGTAVSVGTAAQQITLQQWTTALYTAAMHSYSAGKRMPDHVWCSLDVWAALGSTVDIARVAMPRDGNLDTAAGSSSLADFRGDVLGLPRVVVPQFPAGTCIVGPASLYEAYEEVIGLLSVIEPSILGVQVAYGGYLAQGTLGTTAFVPITAVGILPTVEEAQAEVEEAAASVESEPEAAPKRGNGHTKAE